MYLGEIVEIGPVGEVGVNPQHPYTAALLSAVPVPNPDAAAQSSRIVLRGDMPSPINPPSGCRFHPRCPRAQALCEVEAPRLDLRLGANPAHMTACHFPLAEGERLENSDGAAPVNRAALVVEARRQRRPVVPDQAGPAVIEQAGLAPTEEPALIEELGPAVIEEPAAMLIGATAAVLEPAPEVLDGGPPAGVSRQNGQATAGPAKVQLRSPWFLAYQRLRRDRAAIVAAGVILAILLMALLAPVIAHLTGHGVDEQFSTIGLTPDGLPKPPSGTFLLGTDDLGRDLLVRVAYGARISLLVGVLATALTVFVGAIIGLISGYFIGIVDTIFARVMDVMLAIPFLLFAISLASVVSVTPLHFGPVTIGSGISIVVIVIGIFSWATVARIVRGQVIAIRNREYVEAARALGARSWRIIAVDVLPNVMPTIIVYTTLLIPVSIVSEAALSYLGVGVEPPTADWGSMIAEAQTYYQQAWWFLTFPSLALILTTLAFNILGDGIRDAIDPRGIDGQG
jgi:peptide/nickel transport system permease protein